MKEYRVKGYVLAEKIAESGNVNTPTGVRYAEAGDYLVYDASGSHIEPGAEFEDLYEEVKGDSEFHPAGKTVEDVIAFLKENPDQVNRVKEEEAKGAKRKGIAEYNTPVVNENG
jgi:hypothetical protein